MKINPPTGMTAEEFRQAGRLLCGTDSGWQSRLAVVLQRDPGTISRYLSGTVPIPGIVAVALDGMLKRKRIRKPNKDI